MVHTELITDRSAWTGGELETDRSWEFELSDEHRAELGRSLEAIGDRELAEIGRADVELPTLGPLMARIGAELAAGRGFALLRGMPVDDYGLADLERLYWMLCTRLGTGMTQNSDASLIHYVTDGALRPNQGIRGVGSPVRSSLHVDLTDYASLLCVQQAPDEPQSWIASSTAVHNAFLTDHADLLPALYEGFEWDRLDEHGPGESPTTGYRVPVFSEADGLVSCRYNRYWMAKAIRRGSERLPDEVWRLFNLFDEIADERRLAFDFGPGDVQFINNYIALHGRDAHDVVEDEERKRLLMRIWLDADDPRPMVDEAIVRYGIVRHGALGWTVDQYREGLHHGSHARLPDGRPLVAAGPRGG